MRGLLLGGLALIVGGLLGYSWSESRGTPVAVPPQSPELVLAIPDPLERMGAFAALLSESLPEDLESVRGSLEAVPLDGHAQEMHLFMEWWARFDPQAARAWATDRSDPVLSAHLSAAVFRVWARSDPEAALREAARIGDSDIRGVVSEAVLIGWNESLIPGFGEYVVELEDPAEQAAAARLLARRRVTELGAAEALEWAEFLPNVSPAFHSVLMPRVVSAAAQDAPVLAAAWVEERFDPAKETGYARRVATRWARRDPEAAMSWLLGLPLGPGRDDALTETLRDWSAIDREAAMSWVRSQVTEPDPALDILLAAYAPMRVVEDPQNAVELATRISADGLRYATITKVARAWLAQDADAAEAWLVQAGLPPEVVQRARIRPVSKRRQERLRRRAEQENDAS